MKTILHCADLHLSCSDEKTKKYCMEVLDEILVHAKEHKADFLVFAGDVFDTYKDVAELKVDFRSRIKDLSGSCEVIFATGNHEYLHSGVKNPKISGADLGVPPDNIIEYSKEAPFTLLERNGLEFFVIPHNKEYSSYVNWDIPEKKNFRLCVAHAQVCGLNFEGINDESEENTSLIDPDVFSRVNADYVAMGHIHTAGLHTLTGCTLSYPGSARVWRSGESGERKVELLTIDEKAKKIKTVTPIVIRSAGQYRYHELPLDLDGSCSGLTDVSGDWGANDYIDIKLEGVVDDENKVAELEETIKANFGKKLRQLFINRDDVFAVKGISKHPIAKKFIELWQTKEPDKEDVEVTTAWLKARQMGLTEIKNAMEALQ